MATSWCMCSKLSHILLPVSRRQLLKQPVRNRWVWRHRGKPPEQASRLVDRLEELYAKDPELDKDVNIGFPALNTTLPRKEQRDWISSRRTKEQAARLGKLSIPLEDIQEQYEADRGLHDTHDVAKHYGIFRDLFDNAFFVPNNRLQVFFEYDDDYVTPVYRGNHIYPGEASVAPFLHFDSKPDSLWSLVLSNPDGHLQDNNKEVLHWFVPTDVAATFGLIKTFDGIYMYAFNTAAASADKARCGNIPGNEIGQGEIICDYLPPFPPKGTGFHRYVFILYKQGRRLDFSNEQCSTNCTALEERSFQTLEFYRKHQDDLTPAGLAFFQSEWDQSVTDTFRHILDMPEPVFEFFHPPVYHPKQVMFPKKKPFNLYLDRYRDVKDISEEVLKEKLKIISPFEENSQRPKYPNIYRIPIKCPQWLRNKIQRMRLRKTHWSDLP